MTTRLDAQLSIYFGDGMDGLTLTHSQSQGQALNMKRSLSISPSSTDDCSVPTEEASSSRIYSDDDIYNIVAWQLGSQRLGSVSDGEAITESAGKRKGLKWYKKLFRLKRGQKRPNENKQEPLSIKRNGKIGEERELKHSQSTVQLPASSKDQNPLNPLNPFNSPRSIKLSSPTNRNIRFELLLYEKRGKLRYKLMDHRRSKSSKSSKSPKCLCSNVRKFDVKQFLSKHTMSIDHELQLIQTIQHYKQVMLSRPIPRTPIKKRKIRSDSNSSSSQSTEDEDVSITLDTDMFEDDEDESSFDLRHVTTPRRKANPNSRFMQNAHVVHVICNRYEKHTAMSPHLSNYQSLRKKQQQIELFYREKVPDVSTVGILQSLQSFAWNTGKNGVKSTKIKEVKSEKRKQRLSGDESSVVSTESNQSNLSKNGKMKMVQQTENEDADDELLSEDEEDDDEEEEPSEDDSDASMDSDTLKRILFESRQLQKKEKKAKKQRKKIRQIRQNKLRTKGKTKKNKKTEEKERTSRHITYASLKPPANDSKSGSNGSGKSNGQSANHSKNGKRTKKKESSSKRKGLKKRKKAHIPRFMKSKSHTPRRAHKMNRINLNNDNEDTRYVPEQRASYPHHNIHVHDKDQNSYHSDFLMDTKLSRNRKKRKRSFRGSLPSKNRQNSMKQRMRGFFDADDPDNIYVDDLLHNESGKREPPNRVHSDMGTLNSPQFLRLNTKGAFAKAIPVRLLGFGGEISTEIESQ